MGINFHPKFALLSLTYIGGMYALSSIPDLGAGEENPVIRLASNLFHIPLYAGLAFCFLRAISGDRGPSWWLDGLTLLGTAAYAVFDEWHQSFVPGRYASVIDILLDLGGVVGMLLFLRLSALNTQR